MAATSIQGRAEPRPTLSSLAVESITPGDVPILSSVFVDTRVPAFRFRAPKYTGASRLVVVADDTIGRDTKMIEEDTELSFYEGEIGMHGRQRTIPYLDIERAEEEKAVAQAAGEEADPLFDLESFHTADMIRKNILHNELLASLLLLDTTQYAAGHVFTEVDAATDPLIRELLSDMNAKIYDDGTNQNANVYVFGVGARRALERNPNFLNLLPDTAIKRLTSEDLVTILELPTGGSIVFPNIRVMDTENGETRPLIDNFIGVYRVLPTPEGANPATGRNKNAATFARNFWKPDRRNGQRVYVNSMTVGVAETLVLGLFNWYRPFISDGNLGAMVTTTPVEEIT